VLAELRANQYHATMANLFGNLTASSASKRLLLLWKHYGLIQAATVSMAMIDDQHVRIFDRRYGVRTSGHVELRDTGFDANKLAKATAYGPVNAWGFQKLLEKMQFPKTSTFVDLGCGLGRACLIAAEYGFSRVTGVELAPELCVVARENVQTCRVPEVRTVPIEIIEGDVFDYCKTSQDDIYFMFRAFSLEFLQEVVTLLTNRSDRKNPFTIIYTERLGWPQSECVNSLNANAKLEKLYEGSSFGQAFFVYRSRT
jgi:SAM-dependent methyltransferase